MLLREQSIPVRESVRGACEVLGLDPLYVANEGKLLAVVAPEMGEGVPARGGAAASASAGGQPSLAKSLQPHPGMVLMKTGIGGTRVLDVMFGEQLPRIC